MTEPTDNTSTSGAAPSSESPGVRGGSADRLDSPGEGSGGLPGAGADGQTGAREDLRESLGERADTAGRDDGSVQDRGDTAP